METDDYKTVSRALSGFCFFGCLLRAMFFDVNGEETKNYKKRKYARICVYNKPTTLLTFFDVNYKDYLELRKDFAIKLNKL